MKPMETMTVLNVDDNEISRYLRSTVMRQAGVHVVDAATGQEALERFAAVDPAVVLLDVHLPDVDGLEICRRMKRSRQRVTPVVIHVTSSYQEIAHRVLGLDAGADGYLNEPVEPELLLATVRSLLRLRSAEEQVIQSQSRLEIAIDAAGLGLWESDLERNRLTLSEKA
jgi:DNA-binding response OmpR family regulator